MTRPFLLLLAGALGAFMLFAAGCSKEAPPESKDYYTGPMAPKGKPAAGKAAPAEKVQ